MAILDTLYSGNVAKASIFWLLPITFVAYLFIQLIFSVYNAFFSPLSKFPGPVARAFSIIPYMGTIWYGNDNIDIIALHKKYGRIVRIGPNDLSFIGDAETWKDIYGFKNHSNGEIYKHPAFYVTPLNRTPGILTADRPTHARQRKIVSHGFSDKALREQEPMLKAWANKLKIKLAEQASQGGKTDMLKMFNCTTFDIMADLTFAEPLYMLDQSEYIPWVKAIFLSLKMSARIRAFKYYSEWCRTILENLVSQLPALRRKLNEHLNFTKQRVDKRLSRTPERPDIWSRILEKSEGPEGLTLQEHYSIAGLFMIAGTETTATALTGTLYHLLRNPKAMEMVQVELRSTFSGLEDFHLESLASCTRLEAVLKEGLRIYPPVPFALPRRVSKGGAMVAGHFIPENTGIGIHHLATYSTEMNWTDPNEFRPERWLKDPKYENDHRDSFEPFSVGPRNCLGKNLAWHEMRLLLATVLYHFDFELCPESTRWSDQKVYTLWDKPSLWCTLKLVDK